MAENSTLVYLQSTKVYSFVSGSVKFNNELGFSTEAVLQKAECSCSLSLSMISCEHTERLGSVTPNATASSHQALLELSWLPAWSLFEHFCAPDAEEGWDRENPSSQAPVASPKCGGWGTCAVASPWPYWEQVARNLSPAAHCF